MPGKWEALGVIILLCGQLPNRPLSLFVSLLGSVSDHPNALDPLHTNAMPMHSRTPQNDTDLMILLELLHMRD